VKHKIIKLIRTIFNRPLFIRPFEYVTGTRAYAKIPMGFDPFIDIEYYVPNFELKTIFDVGANIGQSAKHYRKQCKSATIYSFEPVNSTYQELFKNTRHLNINCFNIALGNESGQKQMNVSKEDQFCVSNTIVSGVSDLRHPTDIDENLIEESKASKTMNLNHSITSENIKIETLNNFVSQNNVTHINYLKVDTEGFDLEVLKGASNLIAEKKIDFIETEVSMNPTNEFHVAFEDIKEFLLNQDYLIFGLYEQILDFKIKKPLLRRSNVVFVSPAIYNKM
jgi:FkbM family methyltransferase